MSIIMSDLVAWELCCTRLDNFTEMCWRTMILRQGHNGFLSVEIKRIILISLESFYYGAQQSRSLFVPQCGLTGNVCNRWSCANHDGYNL